MNNFIFQNTVRILFGKGQIANINSQLPKDTKILLTYGGGSIFKNGVYDQVKAATNGLNIIEFGGIEPNPKYETLMKAVEICRDNNINYLLSVGGGSVLDGTKFIAAAVNYGVGIDPWDILVTRGTKIKSALPIGCVMTLPATGSEMNGHSVVSKLETKEKIGFYSTFVMPQFSILDPECISTLPDKQIANGVVDSFVHTTEQYITYSNNAPLQDRFSEGILQTLVEEGPKVIANKLDYNSAANYMWCATMALNGLIGCGVPQDWATHQIGHELTAFYGIDHAQTLAIVLPGVMNFKRKEKAEKILQYGNRVWSITEGSVDERIDATINATISFFEKMGIKCNLSDYNVTKDDISKIVERFKQKSLVLGEKQDITYKEIESILVSRL